MTFRFFPTITQMNFAANNKLLFSLAFVIGLFLLTFTAVKASMISFTHDESYTYLNYVHSSFIDIISYKRAFTNNHILNSILMKYSEELFGSSEFTLRLPNILALILFLFYSFRLFYKNAKPLALPFFIIISFNCYLLDFFGLARGYGLSFAFMIMSVFHLISYFNSLSQKDLILFNAAALLASLSNFTLLNYYMAALITFNIVSLLTIKLNRETPGKFNFFRLNKINFISVLFSIAILWEPLRRTVKKNMLDFGGKNGFIEDTVGSLLKGLGPETGFQESLFIILNVLCPWLIMLIFIIILLKLRRTPKNFLEKFYPLIIVNFILLMIVSASIAQHIILKNDFYTGRFALFLYPLFILNVTFFIHFLYNSGNKISASVFTAVITGALIVNFLMSFNLTHCRDWKYDMETKTVMQHVIKDHDQNSVPGKKISLGIDWLFEPTTNFYRYILDIDWLYPTTREGIKQEFDYYYIFQSDSVAAILKDKKIIYESAYNNSALLKN